MGRVSEQRLNLNKESAGASETNRSLELSSWVSDSLIKLCQDNRKFFIDDQHTRMLFEIHQASVEDLVNNLIPRLISVTLLTSLLRQLILERVSIRNFKAILQAVAEYYQCPRETFAPATSMSTEQATSTNQQVMRANTYQPLNIFADLLSYIRMALGREISRSVVTDDWKLSAWVLNSQLDHLFQSEAESMQHLDPMFVNEIIEAIRKIAGNHNDEEKLVILTSRQARLPLARLLLTQEFNLYVIAVDELSREVRLELKGEIGTKAAQAEIESEESNKYWPESSNLAVGVAV